MASLSRRGVPLPRRTATALLHFNINQRNVDEFDVEDLQQLDANYLKVAPRKLWRRSRQLNVIDKLLFQRLALDPSSGHVLDGDVSIHLMLINSIQINSNLKCHQIRRISRTARSRFDIGGGNPLDLDGFPSIYLTAIAPSEINALSVEDIRILMPRLALIADHMNTAQLGAIYIKVSIVHSIASTVFNSIEIE